MWYTCNKCGEVFFVNGKLAIDQIKSGKNGYCSQIWETPSK